MKKKLKTVLPICLSILLLVAEVIAVMTITKLDMLPGAYYAIVIAIFVFAWISTTLLLVWPVKKTRSFRSVIACVLAFVLIVGCAGLTNVIGQFYKTMNAITNTIVITSDFSVYVMADNAAEDLGDAKGYTFGISYTHGDETLSEALNVLEKDMGMAISTIEYDSVPELVNALYFREVDAIVLDSAYASLLEDFQLYADFYDRTKTVHQITVVEEVIIPTTVPTEPPTQQSTEVPTQQPTETVPEQESVIEAMDPFVMYISGSDSNKPTLSKGRSDVNILAVVNPQTRQVLLINTPRDYYVPNPAGKGALDKLTHCGIYGINCSVQALADLYGTQINYYARINFAGFKTLIDAIGGVTVHSDYAFTDNHFGTKYSYQAGWNEMDGDKALIFARSRFGLPGGDNTRGKNQMKVISAVIDKMTSTDALISNYSEIMSSLQGMFQTSFQMEQISKLVKMQLLDMSSWTVLNYAVTGSGSNQVTYSMPKQKVYVMIPHEKTVAYGSQLIEKVLSGEILTAGDMKVPAN